MRRIHLPTLVKVTGVEVSPPGASVTNFLPGDFILTHGSDFYARLIQFGQAIRFRRDDSRFSWCTHAAMIISTEGELIEAKASGVVQTHLSDYHPSEYILVRIEASVEDRNEAIKFAYYCVNQKYGWLTIASIALSLLTGLKFSFGFDGTEICSGLVASALTRTSAIFARDPSHISPADLGKYYQIQLPR